MRGVRRIECNPRPCGVEIDVHSSIKADKAAIIKRRIYPPHLSLKRDFDYFADFVV
jgi:hypothetical protein